MMRPLTPNTLDQLTYIIRRVHSLRTADLAALIDDLADYELAATAVTPLMVGKLEQLESKLGGLIGELNLLRFNMNNALKHIHAEQREEDR